jgi:hypothetical protein
MQAAVALHDKAETWKSIHPPIASNHPTDDDDIKPPSSRNGGV